jgi:hypothetical protein
VSVDGGCNPQYLGGCDQENRGLRPAWANSLRDFHLQNNQSKMDWRRASSSREPALQAWSPEFTLGDLSSQIEALLGWH